VCAEKHFTYHLNHKKFADQMGNHTGYHQQQQTKGGRQQGIALNKFLDIA
jgi:hypothetical protein